MNTYSVNLHFQLTGSARERLGGSDLQIPAPPPGFYFLPVVGDLVRITEFVGFTFVVWAREITFLPGSLEVDVWLDVLERDPTPPALAIVPSA